MDKRVIIKLNNLNRQFYKSIAQSFSDSRNYYWQGWEKLLPTLQKLKSQNKSLKILDVGCGNGRFASFLKENFGEDFSYLGLDNSEQLLEIATNKFAKNLKKNISFKKLDLIESLLNDGEISQNKFNTIVLFGVLHHIPGFYLRQKLFKKIGRLLNPSGIIIATAWQFLDNSKLASRLVDPAQIDLKQKDLEKNDFILDWLRGQQANFTTKKPLRYCHFTTAQEMSELLKNSNLKIIKKFKADSKANNLNQYYILEKTNN